MAEFEYKSRFVIFGLMDYGPHVWAFESADEVAQFLWGKYLPHYAVFKDRELVHFESGELGEVERLLSDG